MKKYTIWFCLLFVSISGFCQGLHYETRFDEALAKAAAENKPVFILLTPPDFPGQNNLMPFVLPDKREVMDVFNRNFINFKTSFIDSIGNKIRNDYNIRMLPAFVFLDSQGKLLLKNGGNNASAQRYIDMTNTVLNRLSSGKTLSNYEKLLKAGKLDRKTFEEYITMRQELELYDNAELADKYVDMMMVSELKEYDKVLFVLKMGPYAYGKAFSLLYTNKAIPDSIYKREPFNVRQDINNRIIVNTRIKAIKEKDAKLANNVASYKRTTWGNNYREAQKSYTDEMLTYYYAVKDTANYLMQASFFYDQYFMNVSADSVRKLQNKMLETLKNNAAAQAELTNSVSNVTLVPLGQSGDVANALNNAAYNFYKIGTTNFNYLMKAVVWSRRSIELNPLPEYYDTLAHLMYRLKFYEEAVFNQTKAVELAKAAVISPPERSANLQKELDKMKARKL